MSPFDLWLSKHKFLLSFLGIPIAEIAAMVPDLNWITGLTKLLAQLAFLLTGLYQLIALIRDNRYRRQQDQLPPGDDDE